MSGSKKCSGNIKRAPAAPSNHHLYLINLNEPNFWVRLRSQGPKSDQVGSGLPLGTGDLNRVTNSYGIHCTGAAPSTTVFLCELCYNCNRH
jgi:hypothetical protein